MRAGFPPMQFLQDRFPGACGKGQRFALLGKAEGLANQDSDASRLAVSSAVVCVKTRQDSGLCITSGGFNR